MAVVYLDESLLLNEKDIYYNKDKFDSGEINLCFITGLSGSGKSTMSREMAKQKK
jgi:adenylylsulfate kinase-like enzyme